MKLDPQSISEYLPPMLRQQLLLAAAVGDLETIDLVTDLAAKQYPELVVERRICRPQFTPIPRFKDAA